MQFGRWGFENLERKSANMRRDRFRLFWSRGGFASNLKKLCCTTSSRTSLLRYGSTIYVLCKEIRRTITYQIFTNKVTLGFLGNSIIYKYYNSHSFETVYKIRIWQIRFLPSLLSAQKEPRSIQSCFMNFTVRRVISQRNNWAFHFQSIVT